MHAPSWESPLAQDLGSLAFGIFEFLDQLPPIADLGCLVAASDQGSQSAFRNTVNVEGWRRTEQDVLDFGRQFKEVHDLGHSGPGNAFSTCDFGPIKRGVVLELLAPHPGEFEWMRTPRSHFGAFLVFMSDLLCNMRRKRDRGINKDIAPHREKGMPTVMVMSQEVRALPPPVEPFSATISSHIG
jgi:hypothetical protein